MHLAVVSAIVAVFLNAESYGATYTLKFGAPYAAVSNIGHSTAQHYMGAGAWYEQYPSAKTEIYVSPLAQFGYSFTIDQIQSITYHTVNGGSNPNGVDFYLVIYTALETSGNDATWYNKRLNAEPYLSNNYSPPTAWQWNTWTTDAGTNQLTFFDATNCGNFGFYGAPTLAQLQAGPINWSTWSGNPTQGTANPNPIDYGAKTVLYLSWQTGSGWSAFAGYLDAIEVRLTNGDIFLIDLESKTDPVFVDDDWSSMPPGVEVSSGKYFGFNAFAKVQDGVNFVAGSTVYIAPGTYEEQVEITSPLTLQGAGAAATIIKSPVTLTKFFSTGPNNKPIIYVHDTSGVNINDLTVDGAGRGNANYRFMGIAYRNAGGAVSNCVIKDVRDNPISGTQHGIGIYALADNGTNRTLNLSNTTITGFQKNGTVFAGANLSVSANGNTITGAGPVNFIAQNGIQLSTGATGTITNNVVSAISYTPFTWSATGILVYGASGPVLTTGNTVTNAMVGIWYINTDGSANQNNLQYTAAGMGATPYWWGIVLDPGEGSTRLPTPEPVDGQSVNGPSGKGGSSGGGGLLGPTALITLAANQNHVDGGGNGAGIEADAFDTETLNVTATKNCVTNCDAGFVLYKDPGATLNASVNYNAITGNTVGLVNLTGAVQDATNNWWGCSAGPGNAGCDAVTGSVTYTPWLANVSTNAGPDVALYIGYGPSSVTLTATPSGGTGVYSYLWSPGSATTQSITVSTSIGVGVHTYTVTVSDETGCNSGSDQVVVTVEDVRCGPQADKVRVLHNNKTICVAPSAVPAHLAHGDVLVGLGKQPDRGENEIPRQFVLEQNYPNPFNPTTSITYALPVDAVVSIEVYNVLGQKVSQLVEGTMTAGYHNVSFDASSLASGIYMYRMTAQGINGEHFVRVQKMMVAK
jgi:hypothetical protein